jgi:branched-chain amino acid transport system substrate-binding protein
MALTRRDFLKATAAGAVMTGIGLPQAVLGAKKKPETIKIGFLAPLTGECAGWGLPGLYGCEVWFENINKAGGIEVGGNQYLLELVTFDTAYHPDKALQGFKQLAIEHDVKFMLMLGGDDWPPVKRYCNSRKMLATTLCPSDMTPDSPYLIAPAECHPIHTVPSCQWLIKNNPNAKTFAMIAQQDAIGLSSIATYRAQFEVAGIKQIAENIFDVSTTDFAPIVASLVSKNPDIFCMDALYSDFVNLVCVETFHQGYKGPMITCAMDYYKAAIEKTSMEFMEGYMHDFPDFDDPALNADFINFEKPNEFYAEYCKRHPGTWGAVSWEYAACMVLWTTAAKKAGSVEPMDVLEEMKGWKTLPHAFGPARWWGKELFGVDNAVVGNWPACRIENGVTRIKEFLYIPDWLDAHMDVLIKHYRDLNQMYDQRM